MAAAVAADCKEIEPTIVVVIGKSRERRATGQRHLRALGSVANESALHAIEVRDRFSSRSRPGGHEEIVGTVAVDVAGGESGSTGLRGRSAAGIGARQPDVIRRLHELRHLYRRLLAHAM